MYHIVGNIIANNEIGRYLPQTTTKKLFQFVVKTEELLLSTAKK